MENILLDQRKENVKIADFGLSNSYTAQDPLRTHCGSPEYAAPELFIRGYRYGPEVDIWSLGVVFYAMMNGKLPFSLVHKLKENPDEQLQKLINDINHGISFKQEKVFVSCSKLFRNLILKMLEPNPRNRITILQVKVHAWIYSAASIDFIEPNEEWILSTKNKMARESILSLDEINLQLSKNPYGSTGGIFNIKKHLYQTYKLNIAQKVARIRPYTSSAFFAKSKNFKNIDTKHLFGIDKNACQRASTDRTNKSAKSLEFKIFAEKNETNQNHKTKVAQIKYVYHKSANKPSETPNVLSKTRTKLPIRIKVIPKNTTNQPMNTQKFKTVTILPKPIQPKRPIELNTKFFESVQSKHSKEITNAYKCKVIGVSSKSKSKTEPEQTAKKSNNFRKKIVSGIPLHTAARAAYRIQKRETEYDKKSNQT